MGLSLWLPRAWADDTPAGKEAAEARELLDGKKPLTASVLLAPSISNGSASSAERAIFASSLSAMDLRIVAIEFYPPEAAEARAREAAIVDISPAPMLAGWSRCSSPGRKAADSMMAAVFQHFVVERAIIEVQRRADWIAAVGPLARAALDLAQGRWFEATSVERAKRLRECEAGR